MKKQFNLKSLGAIGAGLLTGSAFAQATGGGGNALDLTPLTSSFSASDIVPPLLAVAGVLAVIYVAVKGAQIVIRLIRGG